MTTKQNDIDAAWAAYNAALNACDELGDILQELEDKHDIDTSKALEAATEAWFQLDEAFSCGDPILPTHSNDTEDEDE